MVFGGPVLKVLQYTENNGGKNGGTVFVGPVLGVYCTYINYSKHIQLIS